MAPPRKTKWRLEPHTRAKHEILRLYLGAWFSILRTRFRRLVYIDGFCGPGRYDAGEPGSPLIAIEQAKSIPADDAILELHFVDEHRERIRHLKEELKAIELPEHLRICVEESRFESRLSQLLDAWEQDGVPPTLVFADPFGFSGIPYSLFERLLRHRHTELFVTFSTTAIKRFVDHQDPRVRAHIHEVFGLDIAGRHSLVETYESQLKKLAQFVRLFELRNSRNNFILHLAFATNHPLGHRKMKEAMWQVDPDGEFRFWDHTDADQPGLLHPDHTADVAQVVLHYLREKEPATVREIQQYVEDETKYLARHAKDAMKKLEREDLIRVRPRKKDGSRRRKGTFPADAIITLPPKETGKADG
ncbi:MAG: hypothetical protein KatS3mg015_0953 [Fimbriimonadales bacterium]|nr:MAG: hypothetical protein KatS3mg015_0953 [Fimbriimonadales bacterium]